MCINQCLITLFIFFCVIFGTNSCFIRNCPRGGKRSMIEGTQVVHKCMSCGPDNSGQCVGPEICCGYTFGCFMGTKEAHVCEHENDSAVPCEIEGKTCGSNQQGQCVADGYCCDSEACSRNSHCDVPKEESKKSESSRDKLLILLERLLKTQN